MNGDNKLKKILVVDDENALREVMANILEAQGYPILQAKNGKEALETLEKNPDIDLVISDVRMPVMDGIKLLTAIKAANPSKPKVIMMTGYSDVAIDDILALGAAAMLEKPFKLDLLLKTIAGTTPTNATKSV